MEENGRLSRIGMCLPSNLLNIFDGIIRGRGYASRSEGIRDAIRAYIVEDKWMKGETGKSIGNIAYVYSSNNRGKHASDGLAEAIDSYSDIVISVGKVLLQDKEILETISVNGEPRRIVGLTGIIKSLGGVNRVKLTIV